jgi:TRAP-type C4-dicarboxylate transport system permease large subunit
MVELTKAAVPFIVLMILGLVIIIWQPWIAMALVAR